jgi:hypothetical protein
MVRTAMMTVAFVTFFAGGHAQAQVPSTAIDFADLLKVSEGKRLLDKAANDMQKYALGNEGTVTVKCASAKGVAFDRKTGRLASGTATVVFDLHHRHCLTTERELVISMLFGIVKRRIPELYAFDCHTEVYVEFDLKENRGRARIAQGRIAIPLVPKFDWELWVRIE